MPSGEGKERQEEGGGSESDGEAEHDLDQPTKAPTHVAECEAEPRHDDDDDGDPLATGPSIDSRMRCSGASHGMPEPAGIEADDLEQCFDPAIGAARCGRPAKAVLDLPGPSQSPVVAAVPQWRALWRQLRCAGFGGALRVVTEWATRKRRRTATGPTRGKASGSQDRAPTDG